MTRPALLVVVASTRQGRVGPAVADWFRRAAETSGHFDVEVADLREVDLPFLDGAEHPGHRHYSDDRTWNWSYRVDRADAIVVVSPEYDYSVPASLLNAQQKLYLEWSSKPLGLVTYGGISGGLRAAQTIRTVASTLLMFVVETSVAVPFVEEHLDSERRFHATDSHERATAAMCDELLRVASAFESLRAERRAQMTSAPMSGDDE